ncbi:uncharacterized protein N7477_008132 [Penicillium maclennaniae]|uniref:uncharacterized protein n=1 Tax=Penicillium maclennaniae TaxID=1343394 RepID=UPI002541A3C3|nr:uncharacterized protein N7477_008132 [Penicillium maclennaniae]KAJ5665684.1 hypothetical protein N7477_008132 [Penicillium maclennaniae]
MTVRCQPQIRTWSHESRVTWLFLSSPGTENRLWLKGRAGYIARGLDAKNLHRFFEKAVSRPKNAGQHNL